MRIRLTLMASLAPLGAQVFLLGVLVFTRQWLFALMLIPGLISGAVTVMAGRLTEPAMDVMPMTQPPSDSRTSATGLHDGTGTDDTVSFDQTSPDLLTMMGMTRLPDHLPWRPVVRRWLEPDCFEAALGSMQGRPVHIDVRKQGPHALVAGITGSGKSVLLQHWCLALALQNPPWRLQFVFLDFKGGSAFEIFRTLPHTIGSVCDLDLRNAVRALRALETELTRRERFARERGVSDVTMLDDPPPALIVVVDEFHALNHQLPDYVDRLIAIASLGRSLGMHIIACTQNPIGQVSADMKSNMSINICLRVRDKAQSQELLGSPVAASISPAMPGAAYCHDGSTLIPLRCCSDGDVNLIMRTICAAHAFHGRARPDPLFTPPLPAVLGPLPEMRRTEVHGTEDMAVRFALADDGVKLHPLTLDLARDNIGIIGQPERGKTTLLDFLALEAVKIPGLCVHRINAGGPLPENQGNDVHARPDSQPRGEAIDTAVNSAVTADSLSEHASDITHPIRTLLLTDDADALFDPMSQHPATARFKRALADPCTTVVFAVRNSRHVRIPDDCGTRIVFPTGERMTDIMNGIPAALLATLEAKDFATAGRAVVIHNGSATLIQCACRDHDAHVNPRNRNEYLGETS